MIFFDRPWAEWFLKKMITAQIKNQPKKLNKCSLKALLNKTYVSPSELKVLTVNVTLNANIPEKEELIHVKRRLLQIMYPIASFFVVKFIHICL
jgi:uncharacterized protein YneF (UPF0154 family)